MIKNKFYHYLSPAKLNLGLKIVGRRDDGYHLLKSIFCLIDLFDEIEIQVTDNGKISLIEHQQAWFYQTDLAYRAAVLLHQHLQNSQLGANIRIKKTIPSGSGMGGGSSNAATTLIALNKLWQANLSKAQLMALGATIGADVPFFIFGETALVTGIGEKLQAFSMPTSYFVIIKPSFPISTKNIFQNLNFSQTQPMAEITTTSLLIDKENDLFAVAQRIYPQLKLIYDDLSTYGQVAMTGSGSALYISFDNKQQASTVYHQLKSKYNAFLSQSIQYSPLYWS